MQNQPLVFLDVETTGLNPWDSRVTEIGAIRVEAGQVTGRFEQLVNPGVPVPPFITRLTGIDDAMVGSAPGFGDLLGKLLAFLDGAVLVAHNVDFDYGFLKAECARAGHHFDIDRFCTARLSRKLFPQQRRHNLETLIKVHNLLVARRHRAFDDASALHAFYLLVCRQRPADVDAALTSILVRRIHTSV